MLNRLKLIFYLVHVRNETNTQFLYTREDCVLRTRFFSSTLESKYLAKIMSIQLMAIDRFNITHITCKTISVFDRPRQNDFYKLNSL